METLSPLLSFIEDVKMSLRVGNSMRVTLKNLEKESHLIILKEFEVYQRKQDVELSFYRSLLFEHISEALKGKPIYTQIEQLREDVRKVVEEEIEDHIRRLPYLSLVPLLFFIFPSILLLIVFPILEKFQKVLN